MLLEYFEDSLIQCVGVAAERHEPVDDSWVFRCLNSDFSVVVKSVFDVKLCENESVINGRNGSDRTVNQVMAK